MSGRSKKVLGSLAAVITAKGDRVRLSRGDEIPAGIDAEDRKLLESRGKIITKAQLSKDNARREAIAAGRNPETVAAEPEEVVEPPVASGDLDLASASDEQFVEWIKTDGPTVDAVVLAAGSDGELAARLLEAESAATGGNPRQEVIDGLTEIVDAQTAP